MSAAAARAPGTPVLSVCLIGRNEGRHLAQAAASLALLSEAGIAFESIYVDSASSDGSAHIANALFDSVIVLAAHPALNAGAARHVGTVHARGDWVLYLDGDMELLADMVAPIARLVGGGDLLQGLCGYTVNHFDNGSIGRIEYRGNREGQPCHGFGGAVLLPRAAVLDAGNWPLPLFSYEEADLHARLDRRVQVLWHARDFVKHKTAHISDASKLSGQFWPRGSYLGKKFYGPGQVTRLALAEGHFLHFARRRPWGYVPIAGLAAALAALPLSPGAAAAVMAATLALTLARGARGALVAFSWLPQVALGWFRLDRDFVPQVQAGTAPQERDARIARRVAAPPAAHLNIKEGTA